MPIPPILMQFFLGTLLLAQPSSTERLQNLLTKLLVIDTHIDTPGYIVDEGYQLVEEHHYLAPAMADIRVPQQISVVGYDDLGVMTTPPMTTIRVDLDKVGRLAVEAFSRRIEGTRVKAGETVVPVELVVRGSTAPPEKAPEGKVLE
jgi:hypothetical protein